MSSNCREVCVEIYVDGEFYCTDSCWVLDEKDVQVELVTDWPLTGCSPGEITPLAVDTDECMSEGDDMHVDIDMKHPTCACKTPENSPTALTKSTKEKKKMGAFFKKYFPLDPSEPLCVPDASVSAEGLEVDVSDGMDASPETPEMNSPRERTKEKMKKTSGFLKKYFPLDPSEPLCVSETEPESDLEDSDDLCVPSPSSSVPKPDSSTSEQELFPEERCFRLEERVEGCRQRHRPVTAVWYNIFIGNEETARDRMRLKELGITHVLNAAAVKNKLRVLLGLPWEKYLKEAVNTGACYYRGMNISYCGFPATHSSDISKYFYRAAKFIHRAKKNPENKVFIHCTEGISCAPTLFLAYLMIHHDMTVEDAIDHLIRVRYIKPHIEFLKQLAVLNRELVHE